MQLASVLDSVDSAPGGDVGGERPASVADKSAVDLSSFGYKADFAGFGND